ncbi:aspartate ammonia-lyase, partial [Candidatus Gottesmanbacteria bacterium]|nr:aspartate ammonia-lyase [Candidatus Gottesmanbacteria bacterium]
MKIYYGSETRKALNNFPISGLKPHPIYISSIVYIKKAAAIVNNNLKILDEKKSQAIIKTCDEILAGKLADQFVIDSYQAGAGTSHNMNINEVIANRASEISRQVIHPNDHVNMSQSTNDVIPCTIRIACLMLLPMLLQQIKELNISFYKKSEKFSKVIKSGRTHLQDA